MGRNRNYSRQNPLPKSSNQLGSQKNTDFLLQTFDLLIILLVVGCPFLFAGRHPVGQLAYTIIAGLLSLTWLIRQQTKFRQPWIYTGLEIWGLLAILLCAIQLIPLPPAIIEQLAPGQVKLLSLFHEQDPALNELKLSWSCLSLDPYETAQNFGTFIMFFLAALTLRQRIRTREDIVQIGMYVGTAGVLVTLFALAQYYFTNGKFFWFYQHNQSNTLTEVKGPFTNANHYAGYACLSLIPILLMGFYFLWHNTANTSTKTRISAKSNTEDVNLLYAFGCFGLFIVMVVAAILSISRGALVLLAGEMLFLFLVFCSKRLITGKVLLAFIGLGFASSIGLFLGADKIFEANSHELLSTSNAEQLDPNAGRRIIWLGNIKAIQNFPLFGTGLGSHYDVHTAFIEPYVPGIKFTHAENSYLNIASEAGCLVFAIALIYLLAPLLWNIQVLYESLDQQRILISTGLLMGLIVLMTHAVYDFNFYTPAISMIFLVILVLSHGLYRDHLSNSKQPELKLSDNSTVLGFGRISLTFALTGIIVFIQLPPALTAYDWECYQRLSRIDHQEEQDAETLFVIKFNHLQKIVRTHPRHALAQTELAQMYVQAVRMKLKNQSGTLPLSQMKDTVQNGGFQSIEMLQEWLAKPKILGANLNILKAAKQRALYSLGINPTQYQALILLSDIGFIDGWDEKYEDALLKQAVKLAPHQAEVQLASGNFYWQNGDYDTGLKHLKIAFNRSTSISSQIVDKLAGEIPVDEFIKLFQPDLRKMGYMSQYYEKQNDQDSLTIISKILGAGYIEKATNYRGKEKAIYLLLAAEHYIRAKLPHDAIHAFDMALEISPHDLEIKTRYASFLFEQQLYELALPHLEWAYQHAPKNNLLRQQLDVCLKHQLTKSDKAGIYR